MKNYLSQNRYHASDNSTKTGRIRQQYLCYLLSSALILLQSQPKQTNGKCLCHVYFFALDICNLDWNSTLLTHLRDQIILFGNLLQHSQLRNLTLLPTLGHKYTLAVYRLICCFQKLHFTLQPIFPVWVLIKYHFTANSRSSMKAIWKKSWKNKGLQKH